MVWLAGVVALAAVCAGAGVEAKRVNVVLLGATGNLAEKYLWQGLYNIHTDGISTGDSMMVYPAATKAADASSPILEKILANNITARDAASKEAFLNRVTGYVQLRSEAQYTALGETMEAAQAAAGEEEAGRMFYLSVPPKFFGSIGSYIDKHLRPKDKSAWLRVIVEKPFGVDLQSAEELAEGLYKSLKPEEVLLVDHYMGKSGMHGIRAFGKSNPVDLYFGGRRVTRVEVGMLETDDCKGRTGFYDEVGVVRDTMQNHLMMMLALLDMDHAYSSRRDAAGKEEADARKRVFERLTAAELERVALLAQYESYNDHVNEDRRRWGEKELDKPSETPTYAHVVLRIQNKESVLDNVPIHLKSGKALSVRRSYTEVDFDDGSALVFNLQGPSTRGPSGSFVLATGTLGEFEPPSGWTFSHEPRMGYIAEAPEGPFAYEVLLRAGLEGEKEHFVRLDEVLESWRVWTPLLDQLLANAGSLNMLKYEHGTALHEDSPSETTESKHDEL